METPRQLALDDSRYNSNVQVKPEPVDDPKMLFSSNRHFPVPRNRQRSMFPPESGNSQLSRDPRKRPSKWRPSIWYKFFYLLLMTFPPWSIVPSVNLKNGRNLEAEDEGERFISYFLLIPVVSDLTCRICAVRETFEDGALRVVSMVSVTVVWCCLKVVPLAVNLLLHLLNISWFFVHTV